MLKVLIIYILVLSVFLLGCTNSNSSNESNRVLKLNSNLFAEGKISNDTVYDGQIKFFDSTKQLLYECNYSKGMLSGLRQTFYKNGTLKSIQNLECGELNGYTSIYSTNGLLESKQFYFHDIKMGPSITFENTVEKIFRFYSLDNDLLFKIDYDSIKGKKITDLHENFFFFNEKKFSMVDSLSGNSFESEFFVYMINPPKYDFKYDVMAVGPKFQEIKKIKRLNSENAFDTFSIKMNSDDKLALRLTVYDSTNNDEFTMFKRLN